MQSIVTDALVAGSSNFKVAFEERRPPVSLDDPTLFVNRELSALEFQRRVLEEARDPGNPLLERVKFLAILGSNLDEFFMVRVAGLKQQLRAQIVETPADGASPAEQLAAIRRGVSELYEQAQACLRDELLPELAAEGIHLLGHASLSDKHRDRAARYFEELIAPVLTPLAVDPGRPFPHISSLCSNLAVLIRDRAGIMRFARVKVPGNLPAFVPLKRSSGGVRRDGTAPKNHYFVPVHELIAAHLDQLFPGMDIVVSHPFRLGRDADLEIQELEASDLLEAIAETVWRRQFGSVVMLAVGPACPGHIRALLVKNLEMDERDVYVIDGELDLSGLMGLYEIDRPDLKFRPFHPAPLAPVSVEEEKGDLFSRIRKQDVLLHHPFDSFKPVIDFLDLAARDPKVRAIKQTLYRIGRNSPVVDALLEARQNGKEVAVLVELKARFDEESNIEWAKALEHEGVHVIYGLPGLKTHAKLALVIREEPDGIRRYVHLGTGNYNPTTAQIYTDFSLFTADSRLGADASDLFNYLTGYSAKTDYKTLLVAPISLRERLEALILREIAHQRAGRQGRLLFKANALADKRIVQLLYEASRAGVEIDLLVRGVCCLRPGVEGVSETIRVVSIVGRFLEHSRLYYFRNGGAEEVYVGSADLMPRNLDRRVELLCPIRDPKLVRYFVDDVLEPGLADASKGRSMRPEGFYERPSLRSTTDSQHQLIVKHAG